MAEKHNNRTSFRLLDCSYLYNNNNFSARDNVHAKIMEITVRANRVEKLYNLFVERDLLFRTVDVSTQNMIRENTELKNQISRKNSRISSLNKEIMEKNSEIEEIELRSHVDYITLESLSLPKSEKLEFDDGSYNIVTTSGTTALNLFLYLLVQETPVQL